MTTTFIGQPVSRVDGRQKVTGGATYAAEFNMPRMAHGAIVRSTVANGRIASIDGTAAERAPGVIAVLTHRTAPRLAYRAHKAAVDPDVGERLHVLQDDRVSHQASPDRACDRRYARTAQPAAAGARHLYPENATTTDRVEPVRRTGSAGSRRCGAAMPKQSSRAAPANRTDT